MNANVPSQQSNDNKVNGEWVATFTLLDVSGAVTASQWRRMVGPLKTAWRRVIDGRIPPH